jgi:ATP-dependent Zn protease
LHGGYRAHVARLRMNAVEVVLNERKELHALHEVVDNPVRLQTKQRDKLNKLSIVPVL